MGARTVQGSIGWRSAIEVKGEREAAEDEDRNQLVGLLRRRMLLEEVEERED